MKDDLVEKARALLSQLGSIKPADPSEGNGWHMYEGEVALMKLRGMAVPLAERLVALTSTREGLTGGEAKPKWGTLYNGLPYA